jgi:peptide/nickel transport system substrate-binding protein
MNPDNAARFGPSFSAAIASVDTPDTYTVRVNLKEPFSPLLDFLANPLASIVSKEFTEQNDGDLKLVASGLGPFALVEWVTGTHVKMTRNDGFWDEGLPYLDGLLYTPVTDEVARAIALRANDVDIIDYVPYPEWTSLMEATDSSIAPGNDPGYWRSIYFNLEKPPLNDVRVRQALYWAMDREEIAQIVGHGHARAATEVNVIPESSPWHTSTGLMQFPAQDLEKAKALLVEAGLPDGFKTSIVLFAGSNWPVQSAQAAQAQWKKIGVEVLYLSSAESRALRSKGGHEMAAGGALMTIGDPDYLYEQWHSSMQASSSLFADEEIDRLLEQGRASADPEERRQLYDQVQRRVSVLVPRLIMFWIPNTAFIGKDVRGYRHTANGQMLFLRRTWLDR